MKRLGILRHAKSTPDEDGAGDFARSLSSRGWRDCERVGAELARLNLAFDLVIASSARRCRETIAGVSATMALEIEPRFEQALYLAEADTLLSIVRSLPAEAGSVLFVGHNPGLQDLVLDLANGPEGLEREVARKFPTAAFAELEVGGESWDEAGLGTARISRLILARALD